MLETVRTFGREKLRESGAAGALARRHRDWYDELTERAGAEWVGDRQAYWLHRLNQEFANLVAAMDFCLDEPGETERGLRILLRLPVLFWWRRGMFNHGRRWLDRALAQSTAPTGQRARALLLAGRMAFAQGDADAWRRLLDEGEDLGRRLDDAAALSYAAFVRGMTAMFRNDVPTAVELLERALTILARAPEPELDQRLHVLFTLIAALGLAGDEERATRYYEEVLAITEPVGEGFHRSNAMWASGLAAWQQGDLTTATDRQIASLRLKQARGLDDPLGTLLCLEVLAWIETSRQPRRAAVLLGAIDAQLSAQSSHIRSYRHLVVHRETSERRTRRALDDPVFQEAYSHGRSLTHEQVIAFALQERRRPAVAPDPAGDTQLTQREHEVAVLVARGLSNRDIAKALVISQRTAESHVANILAKRGFAARTQIAAWIAAPVPPIE